MKIYTDGGCLDNGKPRNVGAYGFIVIDAKEREIYRYCVAEKDTTNNRMELKAVIAALKFAIEHKALGDYEIISDSKYVVDGFCTWMHEWAKKKFKKKGELIPNYILWETLYELHSETSHCLLMWVRGHDGNRWNEEIDSEVSNVMNTGYPTVNDKLTTIANKIGVKPEWAILWDETQKWYGDIQKRETSEDFLIRMQSKFILFDRSKLHQL